MTKEECLDYLGITTWHKAGYKGQGIKIMSDEKISEDFRTSHTDRLKDVICPTGYASSKGFCHGKEVMVHILMVAPEATCITYPLGGTFSSNSYKSKCVDYIIENDVDIFTTSCTGPYPNEGEQKAIQDCIKNGCIFFGSAGNKGEGGIMPEIRYDGYWAIGGVKWIDNNWKRVNYSSIGEELDFVTIAEILGVAGTSFCSPVFAGMCGLVQQFFKERVGRKLTRAEMERFIKDNCKDVNIEGFDNETGYGLFILPDPESIDVSRYVTNYIDYGRIPQMEEFMIKQMLLTPSEYTRPQTKIKPTAIAWHYVGNPNTSAIANRNYFENLKDTHEKKASSHYIIGLEGEIIQCIPDLEKSFCTNQANDYTISIECCHPDDTGKFTDATYNSMIWLGKYLMQKYSIKNNIRHYDVTGKVCPKWFVDHPEEWKKFKDRLEEESMLENLIEKYGKEKVEKALDTLIKQQTDNEDVSGWAEDVFKKVTKRDENGKAIIEGNGAGEFDWQQPVTLERLMVILDKLNLLNGGK